MRVERFDQNVVFCAFSRRIIRAFGSAARANRSLDQHWKLHELPSDNRFVAKTALDCRIPLVVLSHADDDSLALFGNPARLALARGRRIPER